MRSLQFLVCCNCYNFQDFPAVETRPPLDDTVETLKPDDYNLLLECSEAVLPNEVVETSRLGPFFFDALESIDIEILNNNIIYLLSATLLFIIGLK